LSEIKDREREGRTEGRKEGRREGEKKGRGRRVRVGREREGKKAQETLRFF
jgi:hypothetical protein